MKKLAVFILTGGLLLSTCQSAAPVTTATSTFVPTNPAVPTQTSTPSPTNEPTPTLEAINGGWSTFHTQEYGLSFLYPALYDQGFYDPADPLSFCNIQEKKEDGKFNVWVGHIWLVVAATNQSLEDIVDDYVRAKSMKWNIRAQAEVEIDGLPAVKVEYDRATPPRQGFKTLLVYNNNLLTIDFYEANFGDCSSSDIGYSSYWIYEQIISTLTFDK
jgi:hypothetical protein